MKLLFLFTCLQLSNLSFGQKSNTEKIKFDGFYESKCIFDDDDKEGSKDYLRFYPNGKVISVATDCNATAEDLKEWFNIQSQSVSIGDYTIKGKNIYFKIKGITGEIIYKGKIIDQYSLSLKHRSLINGDKGKENYRLIIIHN
ncbi:hypothetical protein MH928_07540 [Flavobacterium sp. WW92]|uniref:hypothetical protein n=1 Tax=unclassified Flavobacterium TaxID=196869 RepID=UPI0022250A71|nr:MULTISPECIES: hypothetical protein [unclassified Flavobacterium]WDO14540.1 hypothetical protein MH928_07540 [Flavobacterium sp. WW92]